ncbi:MAG: DNA-3-methyladenine glycosylase [Nitratireductor sp.]
MRIIQNEEDIAEGLAALAKADHRLVPVIEMSGKIPLRLARPDFAGLASIIVSQQVSKASAEAIFGRLSRLVVPLDAKTILACGEETFREAGLSRPKQRTLLAVAQAVECGELHFGRLCDCSADEALATMTRVKGIGPWTGEIYLLFCAGHPDIFPAGDLALQEAVRVSHGLDERPGDKELRRIAEQWSPWRGVAARLLWAYYAALKGGRDVIPV